MTGSAYERVTARVLEQLEKGTVPWEPGHIASTGFPRNFQTKQYYRGINVFLLAMQGYASPWFLTYRQAKLLGGHVRKGEHGGLIVKYGKYEKKSTDENGQEVTENRQYLRVFTVFNSCQIEGVEFPEADLRPHAAPSEAVARAEEIVSTMRDPPNIFEGRKNKPHYLPTSDTVEMPDRRLYGEEERFYDDLFHELTHATGHVSRLARSSLTENKGMAAAADPDRKIYCLEELVAEMGAAFLSAHVGSSEVLVDRSAAYIDGWLEELRQPKNRHIVVSAAAQAQRAADYVLGETPPD